MTESKKLLRTADKPEYTQQEDGSWVARFASLGISVTGATRREASQKVKSAFVQALMAMPDEERTRWVAENSVLDEYTGCVVYTD